MRVLSLGAGVQSSTLAFMMAKGELEPADVAIFADTGAEPQHVYDYLDWLEPQLPFPVRRVMHNKGLLKSIEDAVNGQGFDHVPFFIRNADGSTGMGKRQCTNHFKLQPIIQGIRRELSLKKGERYKGKLVDQVIGISWDERRRMADPLTPWLCNHYPLVDRHITRKDCFSWLKESGVARMPKKSACTFCPYHDNRRWKEMKQNEPESWRQALEVDRMIRQGVRGSTEPLYLHRSCIPLEEVDLDSQGEFSWIADMEEECEGMCGL